mmetsp:Transcript_14243/g.40022  ORF Transcript_14243/g.40022 Transcript_14243/m.40022 type:complete len:116 (-) Transcript_14243:85-432(-)
MGLVCSERRPMKVRRPPLGERSIIEYARALSHMADAAGRGRETATGNELNLFPTALKQPQDWEVRCPHSLGLLCTGRESTRQRAVRTASLPLVSEKAGKGAGQKPGQGGVRTTSG